MLIGVLLGAAVQTATSTGDLPDRASAIIVTGERVRRTLVETDSSVEVVTKRQITGASAHQIDQILEMIPNVQISSGGDGPTIRGQDTTGPTRDLPAFLGGTRPRTTLIVDGRAVSFNEFVFGAAPLWDVERVEVFRTPQTTTQGHNSIAGAIFVTTQDPSFTSQYRIRAIVGDLRTRQLSATASAPIIAGQLAWRASGDYRASRSSSRIADVVVGANPNHDRYGLVRLKMLATPSALPGARVELGYAHTESKSPQIEGIRPPFRARRDPSDGYGTFHTAVDSATASFAFDDTAGFALNAVLTAGYSRVRRFAPAGLGVTRIRSRDWSGEAVANWTTRNDIKVVGGVSHYHAGLHQFIDLSQLAGAGVFSDRQDSTGFFGEATWTFLPRATLTTGVRYQRDRQVRLGALGTRTGSIPLDYERSFKAWLPKLSLAFDPSPEVRAGLLVQRAYNPGGTTLRFDTAAQDNFDAEKLWDFEFFARVSLLSDKLRLSGNSFYYDQRNAQRANPITIIAPTGAIVTFADLFNVRKARSYGLEANAEWAATGRLSIKGGLGLLRTRILNAGPAHAFSGKEFQRSPHLSASVAVDWRPVDQFRFSAQLSHNSGYFSDDLETASRRIGGWTKFDARAQWNAGNFSVFGYVRNVFDRFYLTYLLSSTLATAGDPREFGLGAEASF